MPVLRRYTKYILFVIVAVLFSVLALHSRQGVVEWLTRNEPDTSLRKRLQVMLFAKEKSTVLDCSNLSPISPIPSRRRAESTTVKVNPNEPVTTLSFRKQTDKATNKQRGSKVWPSKKNSGNDFTVEPKGWIYKGPKKLRCKVQSMGCYGAADENKLSYLTTTFKSTDMSDWYCVELCSRGLKGVTFAVVRNGDECLCNRKVNAMINVEEVTECKLPCSGDPTSICGDQRNISSLYRILGKCVEEPPPSEAITESSVLGCYEKPTNLQRQMERYESPIKSYLAGRCLMICERKGLTLAIPSFPRHCLCGLSTANLDLTSPVNHSLCLKHVRNYVMVYKTWAEDRRCGNKRFLRPGEWTRSIALATFPGSGNTWIRHLIESATGIYTGSKYKDAVIARGGHLGELLPVASKKVIVVKSHYWKDLSLESPYDGGINAYRNPYDSLLSEFNRRSAGGHTKALDSKDFDQEAFSQLTERNFPSRWRLTTHTAAESEISTLLFAYEDLVKDPISKAEEMARFIMGKELDEEDLKKRLLCLRVSTAGEFKRKKKQWTFDPFTSKAKHIINQQIVRLNQTFGELGYPPLPDSYLRPQT